MNCDKMIPSHFIAEFCYGSIFNRHCKDLAYLTCGTRIGRTGPLLSKYLCVSLFTKMFK